MDEGEQGQPFARVTLTGARFDEAKLPVSSLIELQRYRELIATAARERWVLANPGDEVPSDFLAGFDLIIDAIEPGSASALLEINTTPYISYFDDGRRDIDSLFYAIVGHEALSEAIGDDLPPEAIGDNLPPEAIADQAVPETDEINESSEAITLSASRAGMHYEDLDFASLDKITSKRDFKRFGSSLRSEEALVLPVEPFAAQRPSNREVRVQKSSAEAFELFATEIHRQVNFRHKIVTTVAGRLVAVDADRENYHIATLAHGKILGKYDGSAEILNDLKAVLNSSTQAPLIRITGRTSWSGSALTRILSTDTIELLEIENEPWSRRIIELASLTSNWDGEDALPVEFSAIDAARSILRGRYDDPSTPGIFPREDGGIVIEWSTSRSVLTLEISPEINMEAYYVEKGSVESSSATFASIDEALVFIQEVLP